MPSDRQFPVDASVLDVEALVSAFRERARRECPTHADLATAVLDRLSPGQWTLEWCLPTWLGAAFGLGAADVRDLTLGNLFGLVAVRLADDLADGELAALDRKEAGAAAADLLEVALEPYRRRFPADSAFWPRFDGWMDEWRAATGGAGEDGLVTAAVDPSNPIARGAPIRACALAACLLAGREDLAPAVDVVLDHALRALVLYDDLVDWEADVAAGRWNAFAAAAGAHALSRDSRDANMTIVQVGLVATDLLERYVARIADACAEASRLAIPLGLAPLAALQRWFAARVVEDGARIGREMDVVRASAHEVVFGRVPLTARAGVSWAGSSAALGGNDQGLGGNAGGTDGWTVESRTRSSSSVSASPARR